MDLKYFLSFMVFLVGGWFGHALLSHSWDGLVYVYVDQGDDRIPAAVDGKYDFSNLKGSALASATKERLLSHAKIVKQPGQIGFELGHFVRRGDRGLKEFACKSFEMVELQFVAANESVSGETPKMTVEGSCKFTQNLERIDPIWIPIEKIKKEKPGNSVLEYWDQGKVTVIFKNVGGQWPTQWRLASARLFKPGKGQQIKIGKKDIDRILKGEPMQIQF